MALAGQAMAAPAAVADPIPPALSYADLLMPVPDALAQRATIDRQLAAQRAFADDAAVTLRLTELRYRTGVDQFLNVLDAQRTLYSAQQTLVTTRLTEQSNMVELYRSLGGGLR